jgi:hypothetical protein
MNKGIVRFLIVLASLVAFWIINKVRTSVAKTAPLGYEDEEGFHFGVPSLDSK